MLKQYSRPLSKIFITLDLVVILISFVSAYCLRLNAGHADFFPVSFPFKLFIFIYCVAWFYISDSFGLYASKRVSRIRDELRDVGGALTLCLIVAALPSLFIRRTPLSPGFLACFWLIQIALFFSFRFLLRKTIHYFRRHGYNYRNVLILGRNSRSIEMFEKIKGASELGLRIIGFVDKEDFKCPDWPDATDAQIIGSLDDFEMILRTKVVDEVLVYLPIKSFYGEIQSILNICESVGIEAKIPTDIFKRKIAKSTIIRYEDIPLVDLYTSPKMDWRLFTKRMIDIVFSGILLLLFLPLLSLVGLLIRMTSRGPIFFVQQRVGYNGRIFPCFKFRTMVENAEKQKENLLHLNEVSGPVFKIRNDPRVTPIGKWLRKLSIDELPQLINVLRGDMSLVGPRPPIPSEVEQYELDHRRRLSMRPGITCLWQVNGRNAVPFDQWMQLDQQYIDHWSLSLDFKILLKTIPAVIRGS